jgi:cytochrome P450
VKRTRDSLKIFLNERLTVGTGQSSFKIIDAVLNRIDSIMSKDFMDTRSFSQHMAFNIISATLLGDAFFDWSDAAAYEELLMLVAKDGCFWASYTIPPFWRPSYRRYQTLCAKLKILTESVIRKSRYQNSSLHHFDQRSCQKSEGTDPHRSVLDNMMRSHCVHGAAKGPLNLEEETCGNIMGLMLHGISTSANLIGNILTRFVLFPELQDQVCVGSFIFSVANYLSCFLVMLKIMNGFWCFLIQMTTLSWIFLHVNYLNKKESHFVFH